MKKMKVENGDVAAGENSSATASSNGPVKSAYDKYVEQFEKQMKDPNFFKNKKKEEALKKAEARAAKKRKADQIRNATLQEEEEEDFAGDDEEELEESAADLPNDNEEEDEGDAEFDEISSKAVRKLKQEVKETGVRRSRRSAAIKRVKYVDDYDSNEFDDSSSEDERRKVPVKKPPPQKGRGRGRPKGSKNKKTKLTSRQKWQMEDALDTRPKIEKYLGRRLSDDGVVEYLIKFVGMSYLHCKWKTYEAILRDCNVAIRHVGMLTIFDKLVEKEGEEKWNGDIAKDLITIDKIIAEKQVLKLRMK